MVKNPPAVQEIQGLEDPLQKEMATHSNILAWRISWTEKPGGYSPWGQKELNKTERLTLSLHFHRCLSVTTIKALDSLFSKYLEFISVKPNIGRKNIFQ